MTDPTPDFTPVEFAKILALPLAQHRETVCDLTGGRGHLVLGLANPQTANGLVCELQPTTSISSGPESILQWNRISGDLAKLYPLLVEAEWRADIIGLYPPQNDLWNTADLNDLADSEVDAVREVYRKQGESIHGCLATYLIALDRLTERGEGLIISSHQNAQMLLDSPLGEHAWLRFSTLFDPHTGEPGEGVSVIYFAKGHDAGILSESRDIHHPHRLKTAAELAGQRRFTLRHGLVLNSETQVEPTTAKRWDAVRAEFGGTAKGDKRNDYQLSLAADGKLVASLSRFDEFSTSIPLADKQTLYSLHGKSPAELVLQASGRQLLLSVIESGKWRVHPDVLPAVRKSIDEYDAVRAPLYPLPSTQRLAYLDEHSEILCQSNLGIAFKAGKRYPLSTETVEITWGKTKPNTDGEPENILCSGLELAAWVENEQGDKELFLDARHVGTDSYRVAKLNGGISLKPDYSIQDLLAHFEIPGVQDVSAMAPDKFEGYRKGLERIQLFVNQYIDSKFQLKRFQCADLPRLAMHDGAICAWATGIGKSLAAVLYPMLKVGVNWPESERKRSITPLRPVMVVAPENLHQQLLDEWKRFFGITVTKLDCQATYLQITNELKKKLSPGWYISSYTQLGVNKVGEMPVPIKTAKTHPEVAKLMRYYGVTLEEAKAYAVQKKDLLQQAMDLCDYRYRHHSQGIGETRNGVKCVFEPSLADLCGHEFDAVVIDEGIRIKAKESKVGKAIRELDPDYRLVLTGTPIKNRLRDVFYLAHWSAGGKEEAHSRFPYGVNEQERFLAEFQVCERNLTKEAEKKGKQDKSWDLLRQDQKAAILDKRKRRSRGIPGIEVCNIHRLWKVLAPIVLRRRKEDCGEDIVPKYKHIIRVPMGEAQKAVYRYHLYSEYVAKNGKPAYMAKLQALRSVAAAPNSRLLMPPDAEERKNLPEDAAGPWRSEMDYTPKVAAALAVIEERLREGEQLAVFSSMREPLYTLSKRLKAASVEHDLADGTMFTNQRAQRSKKFAKGLSNGAPPVMLCSMGAMAEGNNWPKCNNVVVLSFDWAWDLYEQCINRCHRLNSEKPLHIWNIVTEGTVDVKLEAMLDEKHDAQELVIDGKLTTENSEEVDLPQLLKIAEEDFRSAKAMPESQLETEWPALRRKLRKAQLTCQEVATGVERKKQVVPAPVQKPAVPLAQLLERIERMKQVA